MIWRIVNDYDLSKFSYYENLKGLKIVKDLMKFAGWHEEVYIKQQTSSCLAIFVSDYLHTLWQYDDILEWLSIFNFHSFHFWFTLKGPLKVIKELNISQNYHHILYQCHRMYHSTNHSHLSVFQYQPKWF